MIELTQNQIDVFGRPNFTCIKLSALLVAAGVYKKPEKVRAESEQAITIHFLSGMLEKHGEKWREETDKFIDECIAKTVAPTASASNAEGGE